MINNQSKHNISAQNAEILISIPKAAKRLGCSTPTFRSMIADGRIAVVKVGKRLRINEKTLRRYVSASTMSSGTAKGDTTGPGGTK